MTERLDERTLGLAGIIPLQPIIFPPTNVDEAVAVDTDRYVNSHGKKPKGHGVWMFQIGDEEISFEGNYGKAAAEAKKEASKRKLMRIFVLP